jgi:hypothetical protein
MRPENSNSWPLLAKAVGRSQTPPTNLVISIKICAALVLFVSII